MSDALPSGTGKPVRFPSCYPVRAGNVITNRMKVLVIEDDSDVRDTLVQCLEDEPFIVDAVADGEEGLYRAEEWQYDVIVLDVMLPGLDGWQILKRLRQRKNRTPVLMLTALDAFDDRVRGLDEGADDYLTKPFNERELTARIRALHRRAFQQADNVITLGPVEIRAAEQQVFVHEEPIQLTAAQYRIVAYLATRAGRVVTRNELAEATTGDEDSGDSNVIDVQIHHIRRKLGKDFIQNRRGLGYVVPAS